MQKIGRYDVERMLGEGGMATVYLARDPQTERQVVVKVIKREYSDNAEFRARFKREAKTIAALEHPAIVPIYEFDEHEGQPFIAMRYMPGGSLLDRAKQGPLPLAEIVGLVERIADALDDAHALGIIHRDLKPANILFDAKGNGYLSDFGIAKKIAETTTSLATTGFIGTPAYASPEQVIAKVQLDGRSDVYSLGVIVYELLCGQAPFEADTPMGLAFAHVNDPIPNILTVRSGLPRDTDGLMRKALAKNREERYATATELAQAMGRALTGGTVRPMPIGWTDKREARTPPAGGNERLTLGPAGAPPLPGPRPRTALVWISLASLAGVCALIALAAGLFTLPNLLNRNGLRPTPGGAGQATSLPLAGTVGPSGAPGPSATQVSKQDGMAMVFVPAGDFLMGSANSDDNASANEEPQHKVHIDAFWIDMTEVTNGMFARCVESGPCRTPDIRSSATHPNYFGNQQYAAYPAVSIPWTSARAYCKWVERRLPTEAEWEKAARGSDGRIYPWGNTAPDATLLNFNSKPRDTTPVGSYPKGASPYGAFDMAGNVWEWVNDWYASDYYSANSQSSSPNPSGPATGQLRGLRGGAWDSNQNVRSAYRTGHDPLSTDRNIGFRCVQAP